MLSAETFIQHAYIFFFIIDYCEKRNMTLLKFFTIQ